MLLWVSATQISAYPAASERTMKKASTGLGPTTRILGDYIRKTRARATDAKQQKRKTNGGQLNIKRKHVGCRTKRETVKIKNGMARSRIRQICKWTLLGLVPL